LTDSDGFEENDGFERWVGDVFGVLRGPFLVTIDETGFKLGEVI
jgi:hypothetical protein